jgi:hypothetical protein
MTRPSSIGRCVRNAPGAVVAGPTRSPTPTRPGGSGGSAWTVENTSSARRSRRGSRCGDSVWRLASMQMGIRPTATPSTPPDPRQDRTAHRHPGVQIIGRGASPERNLGWLVGRTSRRSVPRGSLLRWASPAWVRSWCWSDKTAPHDQSMVMRWRSRGPSPVDRRAARRRVGEGCCCSARAG